MKRIQRQRTKGWRMPEGAVYVGRPSVVLASVPGLYIARSVETSVASGAQLSLTLERAS